MNNSKGNSVLHTDIKEWMTGSLKDFHKGRLLLEQISTNQHLIKEIKEAEKENTESMVRKELTSRMIYLFNVWLYPRKYDRRLSKPVSNNKPSKKLRDIKRTKTLKVADIRAVTAWFNHDHRNYHKGVSILSRITPKYSLIYKLTDQPSERNKAKLCRELSKIIIEHKFPCL